MAGRFLIRFFDRSTLRRAHAQLEPFMADDERPNFAARRLIRLRRPYSWHLPRKPIIMPGRAA